MRNVVGRIAAAAAAEAYSADAADVGRGGDGGDPARMQAVLTPAHFFLSLPPSLSPPLLPPPVPFPQPTPLRRGHGRRVFQGPSRP